MRSKDQEVSIRCFKENNKEEVIRLWNECLPRDSITQEIFKKKVLLDPNFNPSGAFIAEKQGVLVGFTLAIIRRVPNDGRGLDEDMGWITVFFVHQKYRGKGIEDNLLEKAMDFLHSQRRKIIYVCGLTGSAPNWFFPGIDIQVYPETVELFKKHGFEVDHHAISMERSLAGFEIPNKIKDLEHQLKHERITVQLLESKYNKALLSFLLEYFPGNWHRVTRTLLEKNADRKRLLIVLRNGKEIIGFCHREGEHFGPFGVNPRYRRKGIGSIIFLRCCEEILKEGGRKIYFKWADEPAAASFYRAHGLREIRRYAIMKKIL